LRFFLLIAVLLISRQAFSQLTIPAVNKGAGLLFGNVGYPQTTFSIVINRCNKEKCSDLSVAMPFAATIEKSVSENGLPWVPVETKFLTVHGDVSYDFFYRSKLDTPTAQQDFQQHTERINLNILLKGQYPLKVSFVLRQSNSPFFKNFGDINFQFDQYDYRNRLKQDIVNRLSKKLEFNPGLKEVEELMAEKEKELSAVRNWLGNPATLQKIIEERERDYAKKMQQENPPVNVFSEPSGDASGKLKNTQAIVTDKLSSLKQEGDSLVSGYVLLYEQKKEKLDSLSNQIKMMQHKADSIKNSIQKSIAAARQKIYNAHGVKDIIQLAKDNQLNKISGNKWGSRLAAVKNLSIGRSMLNYTELTAQNITITGLNIEYNPSYYAAFAAGKIDYRFRDFFNRNQGTNNQYLVMGRFGIGDKDKKALILSVFQGRKSTSQFGVSDSVNSSVNIMGYSLEGIYKLDANTMISAEIAKSTMPVSGNLQSNKQINTLWRFADNRNLGINIKAQTEIPETNTRLSGFYRKTGEAFQSFSLFSYNTDQVAWLLRADQPFLKNKIVLTGMLRQNDFTNPFTEKTFKTTTTFKSALLNIRFPKYPSISIGYYPASQFYFINKEKIRENAYYILNASLVYGYFYKGMGMNSSLLYNRYFNQAVDSGFVLYKGVSWYASQSVFLKKIQLKAGYAYTRQPELKFYTFESSADYTLKSFLRIGAGFKYNKISGGSSYWGERVLLNADFNHWGGLQLQYEKSYLPSLNNTLVPVDIGRVSLYKIF
jgi:hypothetical protein